MRLTQGRHGWEGQGCAGAGRKSYGLTGVGTDGPGGWNGILGSGQCGESLRGAQGHQGSCVQLGADRKHDRHFGAISVAHFL